MNVVERQYNNYYIGVSELNSNLKELKKSTETLISSKEKLQKYEEELKALNNKRISPKDHVQKFIEVSQQVENDRDDQELLNKQRASNIQELTKELETVHLFIDYYEGFISFIDLSITAKSKAIPVFEQLLEKGDSSNEYLEIFAKLIQDDTLPTEITEIEVIVLKDKIKEYENYKKDAEHTLQELAEAQSQFHKIITLYQKL